jgi:hypothetical protein
MKILAALALYLCITTAQADLFEDAQAACLRKDYATALRMYRSLAEQGSVYAQSYVQSNLGYMYDTGQGTPVRDPTSATCTSTAEARAVSTFP